MSKEVILIWSELIEYQRSITVPDNWNENNDNGQAPDLLIDAQDDNRPYARTVSRVVTWVVVRGEEE